MESSVGHVKVVAGHVFVDCFPIVVGVSESGLNDGCAKGTTYVNYLNRAAMHHARYGASSITGSIENHLHCVICHHIDTS